MWCAVFKIVAGQIYAVLGGFDSHASPNSSSFAPPSVAPLFCSSSADKRDRICLMTTRILTIGVFTKLSKFS